MSVDLTKKQESSFVKVKARKARKEGSTSMDTSDCPKYPALQPVKVNLSGVNKSSRQMAVPANRLTPLKENWLQIIKVLVESLKLQAMFHKEKKVIKIRTGKETTESGALQKGADFVNAFILGFTLDDALALVRLDNLFMQSFDVKDVKTLKGDHLSRAVGRISGCGGKVKFTIENVTKTRIVIANTRVHILGTFSSIRIARTAISNLIMGSPPAKVYGTMRAISSRQTNRF